MKLWSRARNTILVIHDHQPTRDRIIETLDTEGFTGIPAESGEDAMRYLRSGGDARVILLDQRADWTAFRRAQQHDPRLAEIPVMAISPLQGPSSAMSDPRERADVATLVMIVRHLCSSSTAAAVRARP